MNGIGMALLLVAMFIGYKESYEGVYGDDWKE